MTLNALVVTKTLLTMCSSLTRALRICFTLSVKFKASGRNAVIYFILCPLSTEHQWWRTRLPVQEMGGWSVGWEDPLEEEMEMHSSVLAWEIPSTEEPGRHVLSSWGCCCCCCVASVVSNSVRLQTVKQDWAHSKQKKKFKSHITLPLYNVWEIQLLTNMGYNLRKQ